ncbi:2-oxoglutarate dehydrogenase E1 component [Azospirillum sp. B21]|uniref:2-oxoglutarate dehydrogenase E1 component n=1 Tax=Azospirillum sp. B21 TaxID=2607496 RepID=UPI0011EF0C98|nr:2-oxoglutarate dehydrogenase E1 component [Azospirillum sp. B21]KAA0574364.1 2-oxoglutarate dehydrogenase E1 component [Azospirillum sp. B21]
MSRPSSPLNAAGAAYLEALQERFRDDPASVDVSWRAVFQILDELGAVTPALPASGGPATDRLSLQQEEIRQRGHAAAALDPLGRTAPPAGPASEDAETLRLRRLYQGTLTLETAHIDDPALRSWLRDAYEGTAAAPSAEARRRAMSLLSAAEEFERLLGTRYPTKKRFGAEGMETLIPLLDRILAAAAAAGVTEVQVGTMHRGRLSLMANVLGKPLVELFAGIKGMHPFQADPPVPADVPYHMGVESSLSFGEGTLALTLSPNPSHLEAINPVTLGRARARQDLVREQGGEARQVLCVLLHTDASVIGQGSVTEALQLSGVAGFTVAGTIHIIVNNQIGFTTERDEARTSLHCTGLWKAVDSPILHVNADDPDAALQAADLAVAFRQTHGRDAVIDLVGYRRNGHNEIDEPRFTQPLDYAAIDAHPPVRVLYAGRLAAEGVVGEGAVEALAAGHKARFQEALAAAADHRPNHDGFPGGRWAPFASGGSAAVEPDTGIGPDRLQALLAALAAIPGGLTVDRKVERVIRRRAEEPLDWATGEALAFATLLADGVPVRLTGQDVVRGAFSHRHFALTDAVTGKRHVTLNHLGVTQARFDVVNSPLSEYAVLGFEYGYSLERPDALVIWEAQFGDFANGAQIMIDQFVVSAEDKWRQPSGLVILLPHGLEGQGPEHSSARPERFLQMAARDNIRIAHPSTPANYFHLLRRQMLRRDRKPLVVLSPKTLLRLPAAVSALADFASGTGFQPVVVTAGERVSRILLCSGKLAYELERERAALGVEDVAVVRLEMLYPLPEAELSALFRRWPDASCLWVQEEPENLGAWTYLDRRLEALRGAAGCAEPRVACVARAEAASPAGSFHGDHDADQRRLVEQAFAGVAAAGIEASLPSRGKAAAE